MESCGANALLLELVTTWLSNTLRPFQALVGSSTTMVSPTALLLDCSSPQAAFQHVRLSWSCIVISSKLVLVETRTDADTWNRDLTAHWVSNSASACEKLRYRPSTRMRTAFAQIGATALQIATAKARQGIETTGSGSNDPCVCQATIGISLGTTGPILQWLPVFMQKVCQATGLQLAQATSSEGLDMLQWRSVHAFDGSWSGRVIVQLASAEEVRSLHRWLHGKGIRVQDHCGGITVDSLHLDLS